jgi:hypothetical protein
MQIPKGKILEYLKIMISNDAGTRRCMITITIGETLGGYLLLCVF